MLRRWLRRLGVLRRTRRQLHLHEEQRPLVARVFGDCVFADCLAAGHVLVWRQNERVFADELVHGPGFDQPLDREVLTLRGWDKLDWLSTRVTVRSWLRRVHGEAGTMDQGGRA